MWGMLASVQRGGIKGGIFDIYNTLQKKTARSLLTNKVQGRAVHSRTPPESATPESRKAARTIFPFSRGLEEGTTYMLSRATGLPHVLSALSIML